MPYNVEVYRNQYPIVRDFVYHLVCYRQLHEAYTGLELESVFWTSTIDAHLLQAVIRWCMVFGSDGNNPTHWKRLCTNDQESFEEDFRDSLYQSTDLTPETWRAYGEQMRAFRGRYAAHRELAIDGPVPKMDTALNVAFYYDGWIRKILLPDIFDDISLEDSMQNMIMEVKPYAMNFLSQTKLMSHKTEHGGAERRP